MKTNLSVGDGFPDVPFTKNCDAIFVWTQSEYPYVDK
jgi:hypothetical protein